MSARVEQLIGKLEHLRSERDKMRLRLQEIAEELASIDVSDAEAAVGEVGNLTSERTVVKRVLAELEPKVKTLSDELESVRAEANRERIEELRSEYDEKLALVVQTVKTLQTRIDNAEAVRREMRSLGDNWRGDIPTWLRKIPERAVTWWKRRHVVAAGAEPREPPRERWNREARQDARHALERAVDHLQAAKASSSREVQYKAQERLKRAAERYKRHGGDASEVLGGPVERLLQTARGAVQRVSPR